MTKSIIVVTICYKLLCHSSRFLISNLLASTDIKVFGRTSRLTIVSREAKKKRSNATTE